MSIAVSKTSHDPGKGRDNAVVLLMTLADTTWRMLVPTGVLALGGVWADLHWGTKPWLTLLAVPLGLGISVVLIRRQLKGIS